MATRALIAPAQEQQEEEEILRPKLTVVSSSRSASPPALPSSATVDPHWKKRLPASLRRLRRLLHAQSRIESRMVMLQWVVMVLVGIGAILPNSLGSGLSATSSAAIVILLALHPVAYVAAATFTYDWLLRNGAVRVAMLTAFDVIVAIGVLFLTATKPGYTQVLLFSVVLLTATRYTLSRAIGITTLLAVLQFFSIIAADRQGLHITNLSSAVVAMFAMTYGINLISQAERKEAAIAAENARLYRAVLLRNRELATINALSQSVSQNTDPSQLLESGLELILSSIPISWGQAFQFDRETGQLDLVFIRQGHKGVEAVELADAGRTEAERAARTRSVVVGQQRKVANEDLVRISSPVLVQGACVGVVQTLAPSAEVGSGEDLPAQSLTIVCQELGTAVEKARLREAAQRNLVLEEKNRIAQELHDTVLQYLFSAGLGIEWCLQRVASDLPLIRKMTEIRRLTTHAGSELRSAIFTLSSRIPEIGLVPALESLCASFVQQYELAVSLSAIGDAPDSLAVLTQNALHRVVRESLMNTYKHAHAGQVVVRIIFDRETITVVIHDDGVGLPTHVVERYAEDPHHFGLRTIARQIEDLQGRFEITNGEEGGTIVRAIVPVRSGNAVGNGRKAAD